jgi:hypothetical protein
LFDNRCEGFALQVFIVAGNGHQRGWPVRVLEVAMAASVVVDEETRSTKSPYNTVGFESR